MANPLNIFLGQPSTARAVSYPVDADRTNGNRVPDGDKGDFEKFLASVVNDKPKDTPSRSEAPNRSDAPERPDTERAAPQSRSDAPSAPQTTPSPQPAATSGADSETIDIDALIKSVVVAQKPGEDNDHLAVLLEGIIAQLNLATTQVKKEGALSPAALKELTVLGKALEGIIAKIEAKSGNVDSKLTSATLDKLLALDKSLRDLQQNKTGESPVLDKLVAQAQKIIQSVNTGAQNQQSAKAVAPEVTNAIALLFGENEGAKNKPTGLARELQAQLLNVDGKSTKPELQATAPLPAVHTADAKKAENNQLAAQQTVGDNKAATVPVSVIGKSGKPSPTAIAAAVVGIKEPSATDAKHDPLLLAQSQALGAQKSDFAAQMRATSATYNSPTQNMNMPHIAVEIARNVQMGNTRFQIRLDPPEMGKIDVAMDMDKAGNLTARLSVERPETLDLLQRDSRALERALSQSGLDSARTNLEFSLKQNPFNQSGQEDQNSDNFAQTGAENDETSDQIDPDTARMAQLYQGTISPSGVSIWV